MRELRNLVGLTRGGEQREPRAGADIGAEPTLVRTFRTTPVPDAKKPAAEKRIGRRAMRDRGPGLVTSAQFQFIEMDAVRQHRTAAGQAEMCVDVEIVEALGKELTNPRHLAFALCD